MAQKLTQVKATGKHIIAEGRMRPGQLLVVSARAREAADRREGRRAGRPVQPPEAVDAPGQLWAVSIAGPDDIFAAPSKAAAEEMATRINVWAANDAKGKGPNYPQIEAKAAPWPHGADAHAHSLKDWDKRTAPAGETKPASGETNPPAGETKAEDGAEKKSSDTAQDGPSTATATSSEAGAAQPSLLSQAGPASQPETPSASRSRARRGASE
jgi:hypothetical protein